MSHVAIKIAISLFLLMKLSLYESYCKRFQVLCIVFRESLLCKNQCLFQLPVGFWINSQNFSENFEELAISNVGIYVSIYCESV